MNSLTTLIQTNYLNFTKKEKKIADYILANTKEAATKNISELADKCDVAESTIYLFAKKMGLNGFKELTVLLDNEPQKILFKDLNPQDSVDTISKKVFQANISSLENTFSLFDKEQLEIALTTVKKSRKIVFFALGGSSPIALDAYHKFLKSPKPCEFILDFHMQLLNAGKLDKDCCAVIISHTGNNPDILRIANVLAKKEVPIISISSFNNTKLSALATATLLSANEEVTYDNRGIYTRRISQMFVVDLLFTLVSLADSKQTSLSLEDIRNVIDYTK